MLIKFCYYHNGIQIVVNEDLTFNPILRIMEFKVLFIVSFFGGGAGALFGGLRGNGCRTKFIQRSTSSPRV